MIFQNTKTSGFPSNQTISQWEAIKSMEDTVEKSSAQGQEKIVPESKINFKQLTPTKESKLMNTGTSFYFMPGKTDQTKSLEEIRQNGQEGHSLLETSNEHALAPK